MGFLDRAVNHNKALRRGSAKPSDAQWGGDVFFLCLVHFGAWCIWVCVEMNGNKVPSGNLT